jgi:hypothetical protein
MERSQASQVVRRSRQGTPDQSICVQRRVVSGRVTVVRTAPFRPHWVAALALGSSVIGFACGGGSGNLEIGPGPGHATQTLASGATATPEAQVLTFDQISQMLRDAYASIQLPAGLCGLETMESVVSLTKQARESLNELEGYLTPYSSGYGEIAQEVQKIADVTGSQKFIDLRNALVDSLTADARAIFVGKRGGTEQNVQTFLSTWRGYWLDRQNRGNYDPVYCQIGPDVPIATIEPSRATASKINWDGMGPGERIGGVAQPG